MKKIAVLLVMVVCFSSIAMRDLTLPHSFPRSDTDKKVYAQDHEDHKDSLVDWASDLNDTIFTVFRRTADIESGDSGFTRINVDTLDSNPYADSMKIDILDCDSIDTVQTAYVLLNSGATSGSTTTKVLIKSYGPDYTGHFILGVNENSGYMDMYDYNDNKYFEINYDGNSYIDPISTYGFGIGTSSPSKLFEVDGGALIDSLFSVYTKLSGKIIKDTCGYTLSSSGILTLSGNAPVILLDTYGSAALDSLVTINGGAAWEQIRIVSRNGTRDIMIDNGAGNIIIGSDFTITDINDVIDLMFDGTNWIKVGGANDNS